MFLKLSDNHTTPWLLIALFVSLTLFLTQLLPTSHRRVQPFDIRTQHGQDPNNQPSTNSRRVTQIQLNQSRFIEVQARQADTHANLDGLSPARKPSLTDAVLYTDPRVLEIVKRVGNEKIAEVGHVACRMSHRMAIEAADADDDQVTLILEDDVDMEAAFNNEARNGPDPSTSNFYIYKSVEPQGGHGYALSRKGRKLILELLQQAPEVYETDEGQPVDEIFMYLARLVPSCIRSSPT
ncbi:hypothetical protein H4Q26_009825 [Puccinia striiformis f. sp. tritici PST-130]|nr:hypothetical protein H4Q26_009825 [Puccinia striiformis f. sp. tritici PST-130]